MLIKEFFLPLSYHTQIAVVNNSYFYGDFIINTSHKLLNIHLNTAVTCNIKY